MFPPTGVRVDRPEWAPFAVPACAFSSRGEREKSPPSAWEGEKEKPVACPDASARPRNLGKHHPRKSRHRPPLSRNATDDDDGRVAAASERGSACLSDRRAAPHDVGKELQTDLRVKTRRRKKKTTFSDVRASTSDGAAERKRERKRGAPCRSCPHPARRMLRRRSRA